MIGLRLNVSKLNIVIYHGGCIDGLTAAAAFAHYNEICRMPMEEISLEFIGMSAGSLSEQVTNLTGRSILFLDCSPPTREAYNELKKTNQVYILDHHASAYEIYKDIKDGTCVIDMAHSSAYLAWNLNLQSDVNMTLEMARFILLVEDYDLQTRKMHPDSMHLCTWLQSVVNKLAVVDQTPYGEKLRYIMDIMNVPDTVIAHGKELQATTDQYVNSIVDTRLITITENGIRYSVMEADSWNQATAIGMKACDIDDIDVSVLVYPGKTSEGTDVMKVSLRSKYIDVSTIAKRLGEANGFTGGGHMRAAGCDVPKGSNIHELLQKLPSNHLNEEKTHNEDTQ